MFTTPLLLLEGVRHRWIVARPLVWDDGRFEVVVPTGFETDLASVGPFNPNNGTRRAAVLHDYLYYCHLTTRAQADSIFLRAMKDCGVSFTERWTYYLAVRACGRFFWSKRHAT